jgi:hypothetical protein
MRTSTPLSTFAAVKLDMGLNGSMCANKTDALVFIVCVCPLTALVYTCSYYLLLRLHPNGYEFATLVLYGFVQFLLGYISGYCTAKNIYSVAIGASNALLVEESPLLPIVNTTPPPFADNEET